MFCLVKIVLLHGPRRADGRALIKTETVRVRAVTSLWKAKRFANTQDRDNFNGISAKK